MQFIDVSYGTGYTPPPRAAAQRTAMLVLVTGLLAAVSGPAFAGSYAGNNYGDAGNNNAPPAGAILDLAGGETGTAAQAVNHGAATLESASFTAALSSTDITFAFREDPAFISFSGVTLVDLTHPGSNIILNGNFSAGVQASNGNNSAPVDWTYANVYGSTAGGVVSGSCGGGLTTCWYDGSVQAYDAIDQFVTTTVGDTYKLSFEYSDNGGLTTMSDLSTNGNTTTTGGNGIDILAYAQAGLPPACQPGHICTSVPEPASLPVLSMALLGFAIIRRHMLG